MPKTASHGELRFSPLHLLERKTRLNNNEKKGRIAAVTRVRGPYAIFPGVAVVALLFLLIFVGAHVYSSDAKTGLGKWGLLSDEMASEEIMYS